MYIKTYNIYNNKYSNICFTIKVIYRNNMEIS